MDEENFDSITTIPTAPKGSKVVWAIGGGKGGVGKSFIVSNLAITLARMGKKICVVDLDLGSANLHTCLGCDIPQKSLSDLFSGREHNLKNLINNSPIPNLTFISGANDSVSAASISSKNHALLMQQILHLPADYLFIDLGAGTHDSTLDYFLLAERKLVVVTPEPTSIENAYRFIKSAYYRWLKNLEKKLNLKAVVDHAMDHKNHLKIRTPADLINFILKSNPHHAEKIMKELSGFTLSLVMNQVRTKNDIDIGYSVQSVCKKYFGIETNYVGYLDYDNAVWQSVRKRRPLVLEFPHSNLVFEFNQIVKALEAANEGHTRSNLLRTS